MADMNEAASHAVAWVAATGMLLLLMGLVGTALRRSLVHMLMNVQVACVGLAVLVGAAAHTFGEPRAVALGVLVLCIGSLSVVLGAAVAVATYRRRGTINLDEMKDLV